jgi:hypothetical protein
MLSDADDPMIAKEFSASFLAVQRTLLQLLQDAFKVRIDDDNKMLRA